MAVRMLNVGCGSVIDDRFDNFDLFSMDRRVRIADIGRRIPSEDNTFDVVYNSHFLEHMNRDRARAFLAQCFRVLKPGGVLRIVVPDLELAARLYLNALTRARNGTTVDSANYEYAVINLLDQQVRERPGGEKLAFWRAHGDRYTDFVKMQLPPEARRRRDHTLRSENLKRRLEAVRQMPMSRLVLFGLWYFRIAISSGFVWLVAGSSGVRALRTGVFRNSGEPHKWMYDQFSLMLILQEAGFEEIAVTSAYESRCPAFPCKVLDQFQGEIRKPGSIFMEALKPGDTAVRSRANARH